ncbi:chloride channel protein, CIC family [Paracoccus halophilus]|uniref:Chloride channel protein, CIC family n=1 Tax=Paracoccus halophilus TaxID=376733 RepID=A0A099F322_9RHOB|nr:chloride channel protein [Paracoccus halophilus]KGJ04572.1 voltage-gated chloride channel [Paracoccus halophilus]SFA50167.1 chloride channel protein, CIC family [Paracoccus halophilus]
MTRREHGRAKGWGRQGWRHLRAHVARGWTVLITRGPSKIQFWLIALMIGIGAGLAALAFRLGIGALQRRVYGTDDLSMASVAGTLPWWWVLLVPIMGGFAVGQILDRFTPDARARAVADVIEGAALEGGRVERREGWASAAASIITLGTGGSSGREGPVVHLAAVISTYVAERIKASPMTGRDLLGCAVAGAVAASFNAPIAGALFAHEVVLRHFSQQAFAPIAISAVAGTVINRLRFGGVTEFELGQVGELGFYVELPAFMLLGLVCALVAAAMMAAIFRAEAVGDRIMAKTGWPRWLRPTIAGAMLGLIAIPFPQIIGVGYETTSDALTGGLGLGTALIVALAKALAVAITFGGRMGGGVFSPALVMGALTGLVFGIIATRLMPGLSGSHTIYALAGMGAVGAAVLGAPISTAMIIFEMTGDWQTGIAVMTTISLSSALASRLVHRSFFLTQIRRRGIHIAEGPQVWLPQKMRITAVMRPAAAKNAPSPDLLRNLVAAGQWIEDGATLDRALRRFDRDGDAFLAVIRPAPAQKGADPGAGGTAPEPEIIGALYHVDALRALNTALSEAAAEEHS